MEAAAERWFAPPQESVLDDSMFFGDPEDVRPHLAERPLFRVTLHPHGAFGAVLVAHVGKPVVEHHGYTHRLLLATVDGEAQIVAVYRRCTECKAKGCSYESTDGACEQTGWLKQADVPDLRAAGPELDRRELETPATEFSRKLLGD